MPRKRNLFDPLSHDPFAISRTKLQDFLDCPRCFFLDRKCGVSKPSLPAFSLNVAVDKLLKSEFDWYREKKRAHPLMLQYRLDAIPFQHPELDVWRNNCKGIRHHHPESSLILYGAVDDLWILKNGKLIIVDYKATSTKAEITLDTPYRIKYTKQLEVYQWLFRRNGFDVSPVAYILYVNADSSRARFENVLAFDAMLIEHKGNSDWVGDALMEAKICLMGSIPDPAPDCEWCAYRSAHGNAA